MFDLFCIALLGLFFIVIYQLVLLPFWLFFFNLGAYCARYVIRYWVIYKFSRLAEIDKKIMQLMECDPKSLIKKGEL